MRRTGAGDLTHAFACELIDGVNACHNKGLAHGDLEEKHLRKTATGQPAIIDFGDARPVNTQTCSPEEVWHFRGIISKLSSLPLYVFGFVHDTDLAFEPKSLTSLYVQIRAVSRRQPAGLCYFEMVRHIASRDEIESGKNCVDVAVTLRFASNSLLEALLSESLLPPMNLTASDDWVALVHTFFAILHPTAVQRLLNLDNDDYEVDFLARLYMVV